MVRHIVFVFLFIIGAFGICQGQRMTPEEYVAQYKDMAIREMKRMGVPAAITLAQGIMESESGNSDLVKRSNNHFGIKCKSTWTAATVTHDDDESAECFRAYDNAEESYRDHSNFLRGGDRYSSLFKLDPTDYKGWAYGLKKAGYATNPRYPAILIKQIETYNLEQYTLASADEVPEYDGPKFSDRIEEVIAQTVIEKSVIDQNLTLSSSRFTINGCKAMQGFKGTSLLAIATENKINLARLLEYNELETDGLLKNDQIIFLEKKHKEGDRDFYEVENNETLYDVAQKNGVLMQSLLNFNSLTGNKLNVGTRILLRPVSLAVTDNNVVSEVNKNSNPIQSEYHEVLPKEGLYSISKKYGVTVSQLKEWNNLQGDHLQIGQRLLISK
ncbi:MAG: glucosaminidase domain-containing protein [Ginsengibacter sp.]